MSDAGDPAGAPASADSLDDVLEIETPERTVLVQDLAGVGSRFAAGSIDAAILLLPWCAAGCVALAFAPDVDRLREEEAVAVGLAFVGACVAVLFLYYLVLELVLGGQTPGKRMLRLRVVSVHGGPASGGAIVLRNLLRVVDLLPTIFVHGLGGVVMFATRRHQRIGDLAAGTVVVRERPEDAGAGRAPPRPSAASDATALGPEDLRLVREFVRRRHEMRGGPRVEIARRLVARVAARSPLPPGDPETILGLLAAGRTPKELHDLAGPKGARA